MYKFLGSLLISRIFNTIRSLFVLSLLSEQMIVYYEYFKQLINSNKFTDTGFVSVVERDYNDRNRKLDDLWFWGIMLESSSLVLISVVVYLISASANWPYHEYIFVIILLIILAKLKRIAEAIIVVRRDRETFQLQLLLSSGCALLIVLATFSYNLVFAVFLSNFLLLFIPVSVAFLLILGPVKRIIIPQFGSFGNFLQLLKFCLPIFFMSLSYLSMIVSERIYAQGISSSFATSFASFTLLINFMNMFISQILRFERQRLNLVDISERKHSYKSFVISGLRMSALITIVVGALLILFENVWSLVGVSVPIIDKFLELHVAFILVLLFSMVFNNWLYVVVSKKRKVLWMYAIVMFGTACLLQVVPNGITSAPLLFVLLKCLPFLGLLSLYGISMRFEDVD